MKVGKALGLSGVTSDLIKAAGATGVKGLFCESIEQEGMQGSRAVGKELYHTSRVYKGMS